MFLRVFCFLIVFMFYRVFCILVLNLFVGASLADFQGDPKLRIFDHGPKPLNSDQTPVLDFPSSFYIFQTMFYMSPPVCYICWWSG